jgi:S-DNA-T family DNA segregation ATPase FtsK/SpoIIIE
VGDVGDGGHSVVPFDAETVTVEPAQLGGPVDPPDEPVTLYGTIVRTREHERAPIVPAWIRNQQQRIYLARWLVRYLAYAAAFHAVRLPKYAGKVAVWAPWGVLRTTNRQIRWWWLLEQHGLRQDAANSNDAKTWMKLHKEAKATRRVRGWVLAGEVAAIGVLSRVLVSALVPWWSRWAALAMVVPVLATLGRPADKPITDRVYRSGHLIKLTAEMTRAALVACGAGIKNPEDIKFERDIYRDPPGWTAIVNLPPGVIATDVIDKRERLAAGFRLPKSQVWPAPVDGQHPGQLQIWVADKPVSDMKQPTWPLLNAGTVDYFKPFVYGFDERLRPVYWSLDQKNSLFGGIPGSGKSLAGRVVLLGAVLDPLVVPVAFELKGTGDYDMFEPMCPKGLYGSGADEGTKHEAMAALEWLLDECERRGPLVKHWVGRGLSSTNNVNRAMAERDERLRPIVALFDECQELFTDKELGKAAQEIATRIIKRGRALGIHLILETQRIDKESIPRGISSNIAIRVCLAVTSHVETDLVLGTGAYARGARPTEFEPATGEDPKDSGWGWRVGLGRMQTVRAAYLDNTAARAVAERAMVMRKPSPERAESQRVRMFNLLADVRRVWPTEEEALWSELIVPLLAELRPEIYGDWTVEIFGKAMTAAGVRTVQLGRRIDGKSHTRMGVRLNALERALAAKSRSPEIGQEPE